MLQDFELITNESTKDVELFLSNPINTFLLTKKLTIDWNLFHSINNSTEIQSKILQILFYSIGTIIFEFIYIFMGDFNNNFNSFLHNKALVNYLKSKLDLPTAEDYEGSIEAIHRLEDTYQINPRDMSDGKISEKYPLTRPLTG